MIAHFKELAPLVKVLTVAALNPPVKFTIEDNTVCSPKNPPGCCHTNVFLFVLK